MFTLRSWYSNTVYHTIPWCIRNCTGKIVLVGTILIMPSFPIKLTHNKQYDVQRKCKMMTLRSFFIYILRTKMRSSFSLKGAFSTRLLQKIKFMHRIIQPRDNIVRRTAFALPVTCSLILHNSITHVPYCISFHNCWIKEFTFIHLWKFMN